MRSSQLPLVFGVVITILGGVFLLNRASEQARDTIRKHHLADVEQSLFFARELHGTVPPYENTSWCGLLNDPKNTTVRDQIELALRQQNNKYGNEAKPFPADPLAGQQPREASAKWDRIYDYFYWKRSPAVFELYAILEQDQNKERNTLLCANSPPLYYDYGITSRWRENLINLTS
ncbi:MAG: hypothetical protein AAB538_05790 [Patescibacteria group bacterium]